MRLSAKILKNVSNINHWEYVDQAYIQEGQINDIYVRLIDLDKELVKNCQLRYISQATVTALEATFSSIDDAQVIVVIGLQPFADDKSIWKFTLSSTQLPNSGAVQFKITEDGVDMFFNVPAMIEVELLNGGGC